MTRLPMSRTSRALWAVISVVAGVVIGIAGAFVQAQRWVLDLLSSAPVLPWGAVLVVVVLVVAVRGATWGMGSRWGGWLLLAGWIVASVALGGESTSGDLAMVGPSESMRPIGYLLAGVIIGSAAATLPLPRGTSGDTSPAKPPVG